MYQPLKTNLQNISMAIQYSPYKDFFLFLFYQLPWNKKYFY